MKTKKLKFVNGWFTLCPSCLNKNITQMSFYHPVRDLYSCPNCGDVDGQLFDINKKFSKVVF